MHNELGIQLTRVNFREPVVGAIFSIFTSNYPSRAFLG
jgi:hypothetical protein